MNLNELTYKDFIESILKENRDLRRESGYEIHHINPRSLGGSDSPNNLVKLSRLEHLIAHYLLAKETKTFPMYQAFVLMTGNKLLEKDFFSITEEDLKEITLFREKTLKEISRLNSENMKERWDLNNPRYESYRKKTLERLKKQGKDPRFVEKVRKGVLKNYEKHPELREYYSRVQKALWSNPVYKEKYLMNSTIKGRKVFNNGKKDIIPKEGDDIPNGFVKGSIKSNYKWFNDGKKNTFALKAPENFKEGKISYLKLEKEKELEKLANSANTLYDELKYKVNLPLSLINEKVRLKKISEEEANILRSSIYKTRKDILMRYNKL